MNRKLRAGVGAGAGNNGAGGLSQRRGARSVTVGRGSRSFGPMGRIFRIIIGCFVCYVLTTIVLHPTVNSKEQKQMLMQRGAQQQQMHKPGEKHSPLMLLREREMSRRDQQKKAAAMESLGEVTDAKAEADTKAEAEARPIDGGGGVSADAKMMKDTEEAKAAQKREAQSRLEESRKRIQELQEKQRLSREQQQQAEQQRLQLEEGQKKVRENHEWMMHQWQQQQMHPHNFREKYPQPQQMLHQRQQQQQEQEGQQLGQQQEQEGQQREREGQQQEQEGQEAQHDEQEAQQQAGGGENKTEEVKVVKKKKRKRIFPTLDHHQREGPVEADPLRAVEWPFTTSKIEIKPEVEYLGTLIDGGRHYFPLPWLKRVVDRLELMNYNLIHLRLTDDQTFNLLLKSRPQLAYPQAFDNPERKVWTIAEMRDLTAYAKSKGVFIMPEINVPGHAGAWYGIPDMVVHCPRFICERGYGLPLNVTHRELKPILTDIIKEVVGIFDDPVFLHLGGDEVNMADPCFHEVGRERFDYPAFELVLKEIIRDSGYPEERVVRWEMTGQGNLDRAGAIEQFWESHPGERHNAKGKFFVSTWMYLDTNNQQDAYEVYQKANHNFGLARMPTAIIVGTFELSVQFWYDRNVLGRLLSVAIGANNPKLPDDEEKKRNTVIKMWRDHCETLGLGDIVCDTNGGPVIQTGFYHEKWRAGWDIWKKDICERLTERVDYRSFIDADVEREDATEKGNAYFWGHFPLVVEELAVSPPPFTDIPDDFKGLLKHTVAHTGVIIDVVGTMPKLTRLHTIIDKYLSVMGFNLVQLGLVNNAGFSFMPAAIVDLGQSILSDNDSPLYSPSGLASLVSVAASAGIAMMPEITVSTDAAGWVKAGFTVECPIVFCSGKSLPNNVNREQLLPVLYSVIGELRTIFNSSKLFHLGTDERSSSMSCWIEAQETPAYEKFESKLETLIALANLAPEETLRRENGEGIRYKNRAGGVTQYPAGQVDDIRRDELFFLTVDLFDGNGFNIFKNAKKAVSLQPLGVLAELSKLSESKFINWEIPKRLLAFAMGVSEIAKFWSLLDEAAFNDYFTQICEALELESDCSPPVDTTIQVDMVTESKEFIEKQCEEYTHVESILVAKKPVVPWFESEVEIQ